MSQESIYTLELHEQLAVGDSLLITRVPGGWLYSIDEGTNPVFVPFNPEFRTTEKEQCFEEKAQGIRECIAVAEMCSSYNTEDVIKDLKKHLESHMQEKDSDNEA